MESLGGGRYRVMSVLGSGGMATVYRAYDTVLDVERAIKVLNEDLAKSERVRKRFLNEARTMAKLHHPHLVSVFDVGVEGEVPFLVMELVRGGDLVKTLRRENGPLPLRLAVDVVIDVLGALALAHSQGVVHRDIKPHNVLVDDRGEPRLTDFGIAQMQDSGMTKTGMMMGTLAYMAPEQKTSARKADARSDLYAAGAMLYVLVTNEEPHDLWSSELYEEHFRAIPEPIAQVIQKACRRKPEDRYASADEMAAALTALREGLPHAPTGKESLCTIVPEVEAGPRDNVPTGDFVSYPTQPSSPPDEGGSGNTYLGLEPGTAEPLGADVRNAPGPAGTLLGEDFATGQLRIADVDLSLPETPSRTSEVPAVRYGIIGIVLVAVLGVVGVGAAAVGVLGGVLVAGQHKQDVVVVPVPEPEVPVDPPPVVQPEPVVDDPTDPPATPPPNNTPPTIPEIPPPGPRTKVPGPVVPVVPAPPDPVSPEPAALVEVRIISRPWGMVSIDGQRSVRSGNAVSLTPGKHEFSIVSSKDDNHTITRRLDVPPNGLTWCWDFDLAAECAR